MAELDKLISTLDTETEGMPIGVNAGGKAIKLPLKATFPIGGIIMWAGLVSAIPAEWALCDGQNGTPDLVDRFIKGASVAGAVGGSSSHSHGHSLSAGNHTLTVAQMPSHRHNMTTTTSITGWVNQKFAAASGNDTKTAYSGYSGGNQPHAHSLSGAIDGANNEPPYFAMCFIQFIGS